MPTHVLFQGDSITDALRDRENASDLGQGFPLFVSQVLSEKYPGAYTVTNRGVSGNRIVDLYARIKLDFINLSPDVAFIYVGVNDVWHEIVRQNGVETPKFERIYRMLLDEVRERLPDIRLCLIAPFILEGNCTVSQTDETYFARFSADVREKEAVCLKLAAEYSIPCIKLGDAFSEARRLHSAENLSVDGVHPTPLGHAIIAREVLQVLETL